MKKTNYGSETNVNEVVDKPIVLGLFKNGQMQGAQKTEPRDVCENTLSGAVCSATPAFAGVNSAYACPAYNLKVTRAGSVSLRTLQGFSTTTGLSHFYDQIFLLAFSHAQFIAAIKIGNRVSARAIG